MARNERDLLWLPKVLEDAGLQVEVVQGWDSIGTATSDHGPRFRSVDMMMQHHTVRHPYPVKNCFPKPDGNRKRYSNCNVLSREDGTLYVIAAGYAQYSSGKGSKTVLLEARKEIAPSGTAGRRGLVDDFYVARYTINCEASHPGDGSAMPAVQEQAMVTMWAAICDYMGWTQNRLVGHTEYTRRKIDPRWNGGTNRTPVMRQMVGALLQSGIPEAPAPTPPTLPNTEVDPVVAKLPTLKLYDGYTSKGKAELKPNVENLQVLLAKDGFVSANTFEFDKDDDGNIVGFSADGAFGPGTEAAVKEFQAAASLVSDGLVGEKTWSVLLDVE